MITLYAKGQTSVIIKQFSKRFREVGKQNLKTLPVQSILYYRNI